MTIVNSVMDNKHIHTLEWAYGVCTSAKDKRERSIVDKNNVVMTANTPCEFVLSACCEGRPNMLPPNTKRRI